MSTAPPPNSSRTQARRTVRRLPEGFAFAGSATAFVSLYLAAGAPTPLLTYYQQQWNVAVPLLTLAFAVYSGGFLLALLTAGSLSDHVGRRPVLLGALLVQLASMIMFLTATDIGAVIAARIVQGVATGAATSAFSAALVELAPPSKKKLGTVFGSVGIGGGLAVGSLLSGLAIEYVPRPDVPVFITLSAITVVELVFISLSPESGLRRQGALRSLIPRIRVPVAARGEFLGAAPAVAAGWMLAALSLGLAPSIVLHVFHLDSGLLIGFTVFVGPAASAVAGLVFMRVGSRHGIILGVIASIVGTAGILYSVFAGSLVCMVAFQVVCGIGFGAAFAAILRLLMPLVEAHERGGLVAAVYILAYAAFSIPAILVGVLAPSVGLLPAVIAYGIVILLLGGISLFRQISTPPSLSSDRP
ncbi:MFS transporter [Paenarthrobacter sp. CM16]|uniref:MFS transporter n=1 Tax=Paenarthrobacter sp. CM16 TaxID=2738447 RepID=UPI0015570C4A|nr:MFS transporter [Paenarthrobacter sp. CM16]NQD86863.1 MFS transporter [Paenarthrobacter sp. CM16]